MTRTCVILGAGGLARETYWHVIQSEHQPFSQFVFVDEITDQRELAIGNRSFPIIGDWNFEGVRDGEIGFVIGVGSPKLKKLLVERAIKAGLAPFSTFVHPRAVIQDPSCRLGLGGVITPGCVLTTNITVGDYVFLNLSCTVGHDTFIADYVNVSPGCLISGNVRLENGVDLGSGVVIREKIVVAPHVVVGAQACVVKSITDEGVTVAGVPASVLNRR